MTSLTWCRHRHREKFLHYLVNGLTVTACHVDADMLHVVFEDEVFDNFSLFFKFKAAHLFRFHRAEFTARHQWGYHNANCPAVAITAAAVGVIAYTVDEVSHEGPGDIIGITASSADFREEFNVKREVSWHDVTVERVVSAIAHRYGLKAQISEMLMDIEIDHADQTQESDMSFLTRMADMLGAIATVKNGSLLFILPGGGATADGKAIPSASIDRTSGDRHRVRIADRDAYTGVRAYWLDLNFGKKKKVSVKRRKSAKPKKEKSSSREGDYMEGADGNVYVLRKTYQNEEAAKRAAAQSGNSFSVVRQSFRSSWRVAGLSFIPKCTLRLAVLRMK